MLRSELWSSDVPGMLDYLDIKASYEVHPCFPARVMCVVDDVISPCCRPDCPSEPTPEPEMSPIAGPSAVLHSDRPAPALSPIVSPLPVPVSHDTPILSPLRLSGIMLADDILSDDSSSSADPLGALLDDLRSRHSAQPAGLSNNQAPIPDVALSLTTPDPASPVFGPGSVGQSAPPAVSAIPLLRLAP